MELLVVRHAIAFERNARRWPHDAERPLSAHGVARARKAALGLKRLTSPPARVLVSPLRRARETAAILTRFAGWPEAHYLLVSTREPDVTEVRSFRIVDGAVTEEPVRLVNATIDPMAVQSYKFGQSPSTVDYECRA